MLAIAQSALSRQVRLLEVERRQNLLSRDGRGVTTTDAGKLLLGHSRGMLHQVARARIWDECEAHWRDAWPSAWLRKRRPQTLLHQVGGANQLLLVSPVQVQFGQAKACPL